MQADVSAPRVCEEAEFWLLENGLDAIGQFSGHREGSDVRVADPDFGGSGGGAEGGVHWERRLAAPLRIIDRDEVAIFYEPVAEHVEVWRHDAVVVLAIELPGDEDAAELSDFRLLGLAPGEQDSGEDGSGDGEDDDGRPENGSWIHRLAARHDFMMAEAGLVRVSSDLFGGSGLFWYRAELINVPPQEN